MAKRTPTVPILNVGSPAPLTRPDPHPGRAGPDPVPVFHSACFRVKLPTASAERLPRAVPTYRHRRKRAPAPTQRLAPAQRPGGKRRALRRGRGCAHRRSPAPQIRVRRNNGIPTKGRLSLIPEHRHSMSFGALQSANVSRTRMGCPRGRCGMSTAHRNQREAECPDVDTGGPALVHALSPRTALRQDHSPGLDDVPESTASP